MDFRKYQQEFFKDVFFQSDEEQTKETMRLKNSIAHQGRNNHFYGRSHDEKTTKHLSKVAKQRTKDMHCKYCKKWFTAQAYNEYHGDYCNKNPNRVKKSRKKKALSGPQTLLTCPHCKESGGEGNFKRYHMDNCVWMGKYVVAYLDNKLYNTYKSLNEIKKQNMLWSKVIRALDGRDKRAYKMIWKFIDRKKVK